MNRLLIAGTHSGCGKTTVTCALLAALKDRRIAVTALNAARIISTRCFTGRFPA
ncbi:MAG: hypothetical protein FWG37_04670 [Clostridia bacterium]|nr:hypothetical protein [Clostridia bacterium]